MSFTQTIHITGMTCMQCEVIVEKLIAALPGVTHVDVKAVASMAIVQAGRAITFDELNAALHPEGYAAHPEKPQKPRTRLLIEAAAAVLIVLAVGLLLKELNILPGNIGVSENMTLGVAFVIGLIASISSCMAVTGGLLVALAAKYNEATVEQSARVRFVPHLYFNAGRLISYGVFGALIGWIGASLSFSPAITGIVTIAVSLLMIVIGFQMLGFLPPLTQSLQIVPKRIVRRVHETVVENSARAAFATGAVTFFLPCGFTLALQLYVLSKGSAAIGALTMLAFALGTLPALLSLSVLSSFVRGRMQVYFLRLAGAAVILLGMANINYGLVQTTANADAPATVLKTVAQSQNQHAQIIEMKINGLEYVPNRFTVRAGVPVEWRIDARDAEGCGRILVSRRLGITKLLSADAPTVITFTPEQPGEIAFNCSMGMMTPNSGFTVIN